MFEGLQRADLGQQVNLLLPPAEQQIRALCSGKETQLHVKMLPLLRKSLHLAWLLQHHGGAWEVSSPHSCSCTTLSMLAQSWHGALNGMHLIPFG